MSHAEGAYCAQMPFADPGSLDQGMRDMAREFQRAMRHMKRHIATGAGPGWMAMAAPMPGGAPGGPGAPLGAEDGPHRHGWRGHGHGHPPFGPEGPFGPGFPFGPPGGPGPMGGRGRGRGRGRGGEGRRAGRGDVRLAILSLLAEGPRHGYQLIQDIAERSNSTWTPSPGSVYPALSALQDEGLIDDDKIDGKRVFALTEAGREYVGARQDEISGVFAANTAGPEHEEVTDLRQLMFGVGAAAISVLQYGTQDQRQAARDILDKARKDLYRILASDSDGGAADADEGNTESE